MLVPYATSMVVSRIKDQGSERPHPSSHMSQLHPSVKTLLGINAINEGGSHNTEEWTKDDDDRHKQEEQLAVNFVFQFWKVGSPHVFEPGGPNKRSDGVQIGMTLSLQPPNSFTLCVRYHHSMQYRSLQLWW